MSKKYTNSEFEDILLYFATSILEKNTEEEVAWDLAKNCISRLGFVDCVVYFIEGDEVLVQKAAYGPKNPQDYEIAEPIAIPLGEGITGSAAKSGKPLLVPDTSLDERYIRDDEMRLSEISVPIMLEGKVFGVIDCEHPERNFFNEQHLKILQAIASICSIKISKVQAERVIREEQQNLLDVKNELMELKVKALRSQMNPHFVFNAINALQYFITVNDKKSAINFLTKFSRMIRYYLDNFEKDESTIQVELQLMTWYLELQKIRYGEKFTYKLQSRVSDHQASFKIPAMVLGIFTEHVIENSVFDNYNAGKVKITAVFRQGELIVTALHSIPKNASLNRSVNYRQGGSDWEEQIDLLNRLKQLNIRKWIKRRILSKGGEDIVQITINIPAIDHDGANM